MDCILYSVYFEYILKKQRQKTYNPSVKIYVNRK